MSLLIIGTGAMACLFSAALRRSGVEVAMLGSWPEGLAALKQNGVRLLDLEGNLHTCHVDVLEGSPGGKVFQQALVLVKSWQTGRAAGQLAGCLAEDGLALTLQNGLGNDEILKAALGDERVALGMTTVGARLLEPGYARHSGAGKIMLGEHPRLQVMTSLFRQADFEVEIVPDPTSVLWGKLVINAAINPLTALLKVENGELLNRPDARELLRAAAREAAQVAAVKGIKLPYPDEVAMVEEVARNTAPNISSMLQDVLRGATTEIDAINGAIVREGEKAGVDTPVNHTLWRLVKSLGRP